MRNLILVLLPAMIAMGCHPAVDLRPLPEKSTFTLHRPALEEDPVRHGGLDEDLGDGYLRWGGTGILDPAGQVLLAPGYDAVAVFGPLFGVAEGRLSPWEGYFGVERGKGVNLMRRDGSLVFDRWHRALLPLDKGFGIVRSRCGEDEAPCEALFDTEGRILGDRWFRKVRPMRDGVARVATAAGINFIRADGTMMMEKDMAPGKIEISDFSEGVAIVRDGGRALFCDKALRTVSPGTSLEAKLFSQGVAAVRDKSGWWFVDRSFAPLGDNYFTAVDIHREGFARVENAEGEYNFVDTRGRLLLPRWQAFALAFREGCAVVGAKGRYRYIDRQGQPLNDQHYEEARSFEGGYARVKQKGRYNHIDRQGKPASPTWFDTIRPTDKKARPLHPFNYLVESGGRLNFLDAQMRPALEPWFSQVRSEGRLLVTDLPGREGGYKIYTLAGKPLYDESFKTVRYGRYGFLHVIRRDGKQNLIDSFHPGARPISEAWFDSVNGFSNGRQCVPVERKGRGNLLFADGSLLLEPWSEPVVTAWLDKEQRRHLVKADGGYMVLDDTCREVVPGRFARVKVKVGKERALCVKRGWRWYRMDGAGALTPTVYEACR